MPDFGKAEIMAAAQRMIDRGMPPADAQAFINRAAERMKHNATDHLSANELTDTMKGLALVDRAAGAASFGIGPLVGDAIRSAVDPNTSFADARAERSARNDQLGAMGVVADLAGGLVTGGASLGALKGLRNLSTAKKVGLAIADAALQGGTTGAAEGLNDLSVAGLRRAGTRGAVGATVGGLLGGTIGGAAGGIAARRAGKGLSAELVRRGVNVAEADVLAKQLGEASQQDIANAMGRIDEFVKAGRGGSVTAADVLGDPATDLLRASANISPKGRQVATERLRLRDANIGDRKIADLAAATGKTPEDITRSVTQQITDRSAAAAPLYAKFRNLGELPMTDHLRTLYDKVPAIRKAYKAVKSDSYNLADAPFNDARVLDAVYKRIGNRAFTQKHGYDLGETRKELLKAIDGASGGQYSPALAAFSDPSSALNAYEAGTELIGKSSGMAEKAMADAGGDAPMVQKGLLDAIANRIDQVTPNSMLGEAARGAGSKATEGVSTRQQAGLVKTVLGNDALDALVNRGRKEAAFAKTSNALQGNSTTARQASGVNDLLGITSDIAGGFSLNPAWWATMTGRRIANDQMTWLAKKAAQAKATTVADALTRSGESAVRGLLEDVLAVQGRDQAAALLGAATGRRVRSATARTVGGRD